MTEWLQTSPGKYKKGNSIINVKYLGCGQIYIIFDDDIKYPESYPNSIEELNEYIESLNLPPIAFPNRSVPTTKYIKINRDFSNIACDKAAWYVSPTQNEMHILKLLVWDDNRFSLHQFDTGWQYYDTYQKSVLQYANDTLDETDFDIALTNAMDHGGSGMNKRWDFKTYDEIIEILNSLGIHDDISHVKKENNKYD